MRWFNFTTNVAPPSLVQSPKAQVDYYKNFDIKWEKPYEPNGPIDGYTISVSETLTNRNIFFKRLNGTERSTRINTYKSGTRYTVLISAFNMDLYEPGRIHEGQKSTLQVRT